MAYTYLIGWSKLDTWYYGVRYSNKLPPVDDLWKIYFTSSKHVKNFKKMHGEPDVVIVRKQFISKDAALAWEYKVLRRMRVRDKDNWLNKTDCPGPPAPRIGHKHSEETKAKMRAKALGRKQSDAVKEKLRAFRLGSKHTEQFKQEQSVRIKLARQRKFWSSRPATTV